MSNNFQTFDNFYGNLAQGAYPFTPKQFPLEGLDLKQQQKLNAGQSIPFDFSQDTPHDGKLTPGGQNLPNNGVIYLQPDPTLKTVPIRTSITTPNPNGGYTTTNPITSTTQKGLLTDDPSGFNAYFLTDTPTLNKKTQQTYLTIRGSDGEINLNDNQ